MILLPDERNRAQLHADLRVAVLNSPAYRQLDEHIARLSALPEWPGRDESIAILRAAKSSMFEEARTLATETNPFQTQEGGL